VALMKGFVPTPDDTVDLMVSLLFKGESFDRGTMILDPGCGDGAFVEGIIRWCKAKGAALPHIVGVESHPERAREAARRFASNPQVEIRCEDFLRISGSAQFDFVIGNPPYVPITDLSESEKASYRRIFVTAQGRFDLYFLFFDRALQSLKRGGRLVFITPEKFLYVDSASPLRELLARTHVQEIRLLDERTFERLATYPTITTVANVTAAKETRVLQRTGRSLSILLPTNGVSWLPLIHGVRSPKNSDGVTLGSICRRISCGVATGADSVFVHKTKSIDRDLLLFAYPTIAGRQLGENNPTLRTDHSMLVPYRKDGTLIAEHELGSLRHFLSRPSEREKLMARTCVERKPWYAFHETPPLSDILRPKILCKDITRRPQFWIDRTGELVPRHSTYYIVPRDPRRLDEICEYLNSIDAQKWLTYNCQHALNNFLRLQSRVLRQMPIPRQFMGKTPRVSDPSHSSLFELDSPVR
jgi:adenine-specific DNA-methyltransferase